MQEYFTALFFVCVLSGVVNVLSPSDSAKKYIEYLCALCVITAMITPIFHVLPTKNDFMDILGEYGPESQSYEEIYNNFWNAEDERSAAQALAVSLADQLGMSREWFYAELCVLREGGNRTLEGVRLHITDIRAIAADPEIIRTYFLETVGVDCEIVYDINDE